MRIGKAGEGWKLLMKKLEFERCLVVAQALGQAQAVMNDAGAYCSERIAFKKTHWKNRSDPRSPCSNGEHSPECTCSSLSSCFNAR